MSEQGFEFKDVSEFSTATSSSNANHASEETRKRKAADPISIPSSSTISRVDGASSKGNTLEVQNKRFKKDLTALVSKHFLCPITQFLMVDPVMAQDEHTYERSAIVTWLGKKHTSPMVPSHTIDASRLLSNRSVRGAIEALVESGGIEEDLIEEWLELKNQLEMEKVWTKARELLRKGNFLEAAKLGLPTAQGMVSEYYYYGAHGFEKDDSKAFEFAMKAAESGDPRGQIALGTMYMDGSGVTAKDWAAAAKWFLLGHECSMCGFEAAGHEQYAMCSLGNVFRVGGYGLAQDLETAFTWYKKAEERCGLAHAQLSLGHCYYFGKGVPKDFSAARDWYQKSAAQGDRRAQYALGRMKLSGKGGPPNYVEGATLVGMAAEQGFKAAIDELNSIVALGFSAFYKKEATWLEITNSQYMLAECPLIGHELPDVPTDCVTARSWLEKRAAQGDRIAQYELGRMTWRGEGGRQNCVEGATLMGKSLGSLVQSTGPFCSLNLIQGGVNAPRLTLPLELFPDELEGLFDLESTDVPR